jgi:hypothetical protein
VGRWSEHPRRDLHVLVYPTRHFPLTADRHPYGRGVGPGEGEPVLDEATENLTHPPDKLVETVRETLGMLSAEERADRAGGTAEDAVAYVLLPRSSKVTSQHTSR